MKDQNTNRVLAAIVAVIATLAIFVATTANQATKQLDRGTPEGVVQKYLSSVVAGDFDEAAKMFDPSSPCKVQDLDRSYFTPDVRINLVSSTETGTSAVVKINLEIANGMPVGNFYTEEHTIRLAKSGSNWLITGIPWPMYDCGGIVKW